MKIATFASMVWTQITSALFVVSVPLATGELARTKVPDHWMKSPTSKGTCSLGSGPGTARAPVGVSATTLLGWRAAAATAPG